MKKINEYMNEIPYSIQSINLLSKILNAVLPDLYFNDNNKCYEFKLETAEAIKKLSFSENEHKELERLNDNFNQQVISSAMNIIDENNLNE